MAPETTVRLRACHCCGLVQRVPRLAPGTFARCARCGLRIASSGRFGRERNQLAAGAALGALVIYPLAITLPIMRIERFGHQNDASIWTGGVGLLEEGQVFVGLVVLLCSIVIPLFKLIGLLVITRPRSILAAEHMARTYRIIEWTGRWGMLDVLLIALVVAWLKVGDVVQVTAGPAAFAFTLCVGLSLIATAFFDPHLLWEPDLEDTSNSENAAS